MKGLSLEVRVGMLILVAVILLGVFIFALGGFDALARGKVLYIDFNNPGNLNGGAPVNVGNVRVGRVDSIDYRGGEVDPEVGRPVYIRVKVVIDTEYFDTIHDDALIYVTQTSIVGESLIGIDPGSPDATLVEHEQVLVGVDPPRMDLAFAMAYELLSNLNGLLRDNREELDSMLSSMSNVLRSVDGIMTRHSDRIDRIIENVETITDETGQLVHSANEIVSGPRLDRILRNTDQTLASVNRNIDPLLTDTRSVIGKVDTLLDDIAGDEQRAQIQQILRDGAEITSDATAAVSDGREIVAHIRQGRGTVGALLMDEELYDDIQEMVRDLKHNPWKLFWRD